MSEEGLILNGEIWEQKKFPCFTIMVIMLEHIDGELRFGKLGISESNKQVPLLMNEECGKWYYTQAELKQNLSDRNYTFKDKGTVITHGEVDRQWDAGTKRMNQAIENGAAANMYRDACKAIWEFVGEEDGYGANTPGYQAAIDKLRNAIKDKPTEPTTTESSSEPEQT